MDKQVEQVSLLVGIGASAGGLEAINELLEGLPAPDGSTFLVLQHQSPRSDSQVFSGILRTHTHREVVTAEDGAEIGPNQVIVAPPGWRMTVARGRVRLWQTDEPAREMVIDALFRSLAREAGERSVAVVLSGSNADGMLGARAVRVAGGVVVAQDPDTAAFKTMPESVVDAGICEVVLPPKAIGAELAAIFSGGGIDASITAEVREQIVQLVRERIGYDFSSYKENTVTRRIQRRMSLLRMDRLDAYVEYARRNSDEVHALFRDLLIGVTGFFRDGAAFDRLYEILVGRCLPGLEGGVFRAWVPGCATGEEAYSVAMVLQEAAEAADMSIGANIFATDLDDRAIDAARRGVFSPEAVSDVPERRLKRFFVEESGRYRVLPAIREMLVFAVQDITGDPPFSKLDVVCCRNLLIYLKPDAQRTVLNRIRYGLKPGGILMLGSSESIGPLSGSFETLDKTHRIYRLKENGDAKDPAAQRTVVWSRATRAAGSGMSPARGAEDRDAFHIKQATERFLLDIASPAVLVNANGDALYFHGRTGGYFQPAPGPARNNIIEMADKDLSFELSSLLGKAALQDTMQVRLGVRCSLSGRDVSVDIYVRPAKLDVCDEPCFLVSLVEDRTRRQEDMERGARLSSDEQDRIRELQEELRLTRQDMRAMMEEYQATNEELKSANEELQSSNEELKSTNEELETSKEELQSINEEQATLNTELEEKNIELSRARDDINNLLASTQIATLFLDDRLAIRRFTPAMQEIMWLRESDVGRPVGELSFRVDYGELEEDVERVLSNLEPAEREVCSDDDRWYLVRIVPYRTAQEIIDGVVVTFNEITRFKRLRDP